MSTGTQTEVVMRGAKASYDKALWLLGRAKELADYPVLTKSGIIVGLDRAAFLHERRALPVLRTDADELQRVAGDRRGLGAPTCQRPVPFSV